MHGRLGQKTFPPGTGPMKTSTRTTPMVPVMSISDRALAAIATLGAIGTIAFGIVAFSGATVPDVDEEIDVPSLGGMMRPSRMDTGSSMWDTLAAVGQSVLSYNAAIHATGEIGPLRVAIGTGNVVSIDFGVFGRPLASLRIDASVCGARPSPTPAADPEQTELAVAPVPASIGELRFVSESVEFAPSDEPILTRAARWTRDGYCTAWPDSVDYSAPTGKRIYLDDLPISAPSILVGEAGVIVTLSDA